MTGTAFAPIWRLLQVYVHLKKIPHKFKRAYYTYIFYIIIPIGGILKSIISQNCVNQEWVMPGKYYFAGLIPSNEALSRELLYPNEHLQESLVLYLYD